MRPSGLSNEAGLNPRLRGPTSRSTASAGPFGGARETPCVNLPGGGGSGRRRGVPDRMAWRRSRHARGRGSRRGGGPAGRAGGGARGARARGGPRCARRGGTAVRAPGGYVFRGGKGLRFAPPPPLDQSPKSARAPKGRQPRASWCSVGPSGLNFLILAIQGLRAARLPLATFCPRLRRSSLCDTLTPGRVTGLLR
jgi:hypothetical protein